MTTFVISVRLIMNGENMDFRLKAAITRRVGEHYIKEFCSKLEDIYPFIYGFKCASNFFGKEFAVYDRSMHLLTRFCVNDYELNVLKDNTTAEIEINYSEVQNLWVNILKEIDEDVYESGLIEYNK